MTDFCTTQTTNNTRFPAQSEMSVMQNSRILHLKIDFAAKRQYQDGEMGRRAEGETRSHATRCFTPTLPLSPSPTLLTLVLILFLTGAHARAAGTGSAVKFNEEGIAHVDGKPFFPIGVFTYSMDSTVLAELREVHANTVLNGFQPNQLDLLHQHGLMAVCFTSDDWIKAAANHPATLAWYLTDEPENRGV